MAMAGMNEVIEHTAISEGNADAIVSSDTDVEAYPQEVNAPVTENDIQGLDAQGSQSQETPAGTAGRDIQDESQSIQAENEGIQDENQGVQAASQDTQTEASQEADSPPAHTIDDIYVEMQGISKTLEGIQETQGNISVSQGGLLAVQERTLRSQAFGNTLLFGVLAFTVVIAGFLLARIVWRKF